MAHNIENGPGATPVKRIWYRSSLFNASVIGAVGFLAPGLWNAMNSLGAGGEEKPFLVNAANALVFALMGFFCLFGGPIANRIGLKWTLLLGAVGYPIYSAGLYTNNRFGTIWLVLVGSAACGISAGLFWASEGAIAIGYPEPSKRARYLNIWVWWRTLGPLIGDSIVLGLNINAAGIGSISHTTYLVVTWIYVWVIQAEFSAHPPKLDYKTSGFVKGAFAVWLWAFAQQTAQNWLYYIIGSMTDNIAELTRLTGILRGQESFGQAVSYGLNSKKWYGGRVPMAVNTILLGRSSPVTD